MKIYNDLEQLSDEWWAVRARKMTASNTHAQCIAACGKGLNSYIKEIMCEVYSSNPKDVFSNVHTKRGNELEDSAGMVYAFENDVEIRKVGFVEMNDFVGVSPDLFVNDNGMAEIKCPADKGYFAMFLGEKPDTKYVWQCMMQILVCEKEWCDLVFYNPGFNQSTVTHRILPDEKKFDKLRKGFAIGTELIKKIEDKMNKIGG